MNPYVALELDGECFAAISLACLLQLLVAPTSFLSEDVI